MDLPRSCGLLLHITSLPGTEGIGTLGREARWFADMLCRSGQRCWQVLPLGPVSPLLDYCPYAATSTFAGNPLMISLEELAGASWVQAPLHELQSLGGDFVDFDRVVPIKMELLRAVAADFFSRAPDIDRRDFEAFCQREAHWLDEYALFAALAEQFETNCWLDWPQALVQRRPEALQSWQEQLDVPVRVQKFLQYLFYAQWTRIKRYCNSRGIVLIGDIPIYVSMDSADVWANAGVFDLRPRTKKPTCVAGVPPDYFSKTGQRWGNPLYRWFDAAGRLHPDTLGWWTARVRHLLQLVDIIRIDHFRGVESYWSIPAREKTAIKGAWRSGPGRALFDHLGRELGDLPLIAEDLGDITPAVHTLRQELGLPGMKVLQFAFDGSSSNAYLPHAYEDTNCIVYTGTHDNNTTNGWFYDGELDRDGQARVLQYIGTDSFSDFHWHFIRLAYSSVGRMVIVPMQDVLGYGSPFRMNTPGTRTGNWRWRLRTGVFSAEMAGRLERLGYLYGRVPAESRP